MVKYRLCAEIAGSSPVEDARVMVSGVSMLINSLSFAFIAYTQRTRLKAGERTNYETTP